MYIGYREEEFRNVIDWKKAIELRNELRRKGEVLPATKDVVFKNLMINSHMFLSIILEHFLGIDKKVIEKNMYLENTELPVSNAKEQRKVTDIMVRVGRNVINLEMNAKNYLGLVDRNVKYITKAFSELSLSGEGYEDANIAIQINFDLDWQYDDREIIKFVLMDPINNIVLTESLQIYNINLLKFHEKYYNNVELSEFERAVTLLTLNKKEDMEKISEGVEGLMEAKEEIKKLSENLGIIGVYDYEKQKEWEWKQLAKEYVKDDLALIDSLKEENALITKQIEEDKKSLEEGQKSLEEGQKSLEEGQKSLEEGQKSLEERNRAFEEDRKSFEEDKNSFEKEKKDLAKRMLEMNLSIKDIIKTTGLSKKEIEELKNS